MKRLGKFLFVAIVLISTVALPIAAQEEEPPAGPGEGGVLIAATWSEPGTFNAFYCTSTSCSDEASAFMLPGLVGIDVSQAVFAKGIDSDSVPMTDWMALDWDISEDGYTYTFYLRDDTFWTDGTPVTAYDAEWSYQVVVDPEAATPGAWIEEIFQEVVALDDYTLQITFAENTCGVIRYADYFAPWMPKHVFEGVAMADLENHEYGTNPSVSAGVFQFGEYRVGEQFSMVANQEYPDAIYGYVVPTGRIVSLVPDQTVLIEQLLAGEITEARNPAPDRRDDIYAAAEEGTLQVYEYPGNTWDYMMFNMADPENPQPGRDEEGNLIDQGHHPLFGDKYVRQAIAMAIDVDAIIEGAVFGYGTRMTANITPDSWAYNHDLPPTTYDPEAALALLAEAGWVPGDDGVLVATEDALYAEPGTRFEFSLRTNQGNTRREAIATIVQDQLTQLGMVVDYQAIEWNTLLELTDSQTWDVAIMGWRAGYPDDPAASTRQIFFAENDVPEGSSNDMSFYNEEIESLVIEAVNTPGCATEDMKPYFDRIQEIMQDEMPYLWLYSIDGMYVTRSDVVNFNPYPAQMYWNVDTWALEAHD
jgi:peptide/nickel transport system substrate-binding protein